MLAVSPREELDPPTPPKKKCPESGGATLVIISVVYHFIAINPKSTDLKW